MDSLWWFVALITVVVCGGLRDYAIKRGMKKCAAISLLICLANLLGLLGESLFIDNDIIRYCLLYNIAFTIFSFIKYLYNAKRDKERTERNKLQETASAKTERIEN
jgi:hypothetical protein